MNKDYFPVVLGAVGVTAIAFVFFFVSGVRGIHLITEEQEVSSDLFFKNVRFYKYKCYGDYNFGDPLLQIMQYPEYGLDEDYIPDNLVAISSIYLVGGRQVQVQGDVKQPAEAFLAAARAAGHPVVINSGYRTFEQQKQLALLPEGDLDHPKTAIPGFSEHHLGTAVDISVPAIYGFDAVGAGYTWLAANAEQYGFILSYPKGKEEETGFRHEPWHFRYVGISNAQRLNADDTLLNELTNAYLLNTDDGKLYPHAFSSKPLFVGVLRGNELRQILEYKFIDSVISVGHITGIIAKIKSKESFIYPSAEGETIAVSVIKNTFTHNSEDLELISAQTIISEKPLIIEMVYIPRINSYLVVSYLSPINQSKIVLPYLLQVCN